MTIFFLFREADQDNTPMSNSPLLSDEEDMGEDNDQDEDWKCTAEDLQQEDSEE